MTSEKTNNALQLIQELLTDPVDFENRGRGNQLLEFYCDGIPLDSLIPLLSHHHVSVRRTAMFVVAELGVGGRPLIDAITTLVNDSDPHIAWDAMESVFLCATDAMADRFVVVIKQLGNCSRPLRRLAMRLISKASLSQLHGARSRCEELGNDAQIHYKCLQMLLDSESSSVHGIQEMLDSSTELIRLYGAILAKRTMAIHPKAIEHATSNENLDVRLFALEAVNA